MYKNNQLWNRYFLRSQKISYRYRETPWCPSIYIIDLNQLLLLFLLTITKQKYFSYSPKLLFNYIVFEFTLLLVVRPQYSKNYIATISCTWEWASNNHLNRYPICRDLWSSVFQANFHPICECMFRLSFLTNLNIYKDYFKGRKRWHKLHKSTISQV